MKNFDVERGECAKNNTNGLDLNPGSTTYAWHALAAVVLLYLVFVMPNSTRVVHAIVALLAVALLAQAGFCRVNREAQACARPADPGIEWTDNTKYWFREPLFLIMCLASLGVGLCIAAPGSVGCYDPSSVLPAPGSTGETVVRMLALLPLLSFLYYLVWVAGYGGELVKPVRSDMKGWERPLAIYFALVFLPCLAYSVLGSRLWEEDRFEWLQKIATFRPLCLVFLFAAGYVFVWRLQGGLFLGKDAYKKLQQQVQDAK